VSISELIKYEAIGESEACEDCSAELLRRFEDSANSETCEGLDSVPSPKKQTNKLNTKQLGNLTPSSETKLNHC